MKTLIANTKFSCFTVFAITVLALFFAFPVRASVGLSVSPQKFDLVIFPGDSYVAKINLGNRSDLPMPISIRAVPFGAEDGTGAMRLERPDPEGHQSWIKFDISDLILEPGETRRLDFRIDVPPDSEPGGYYLFVYFEPRFPSYYFKEMGPQVIPAIGVPFLISTAPLLLDPESGNEFEVLEFSIPKEDRVLSLENALNQVLGRFGRLKTNVALAETKRKTAANAQMQIIKTQPTEFIVRVKNNDIYHIRPFGYLSIYNVFGGKIGEAELKGQTILPGKSRDFIIAFNNENDSALSHSPFLNFGARLSKFMPFGRYRAELDILAASPVRGEISPAEGTPSLAFFSLAFFYLMIISAIIVLILFFGRKRIIPALYALMSKKNEA